MTEYRERFCAHCGRANPITMPRCMNCGQRVGGTVLVSENEEDATRAPWWQTSTDSAIPPPPQVREQIARQDAARREQERIVEEQSRFQERLEEERKRSAARLAALRDRRPEQTEDKTTVGQTAKAQTTVANCQRCDAPLGQAGHTFSFCLNCGADVNVNNIKTTATATPAGFSAVKASSEEKTKGRPTVSQTMNGSATFSVVQTPPKARSEVNPLVPAVLSFMFPGIGQFINGQPTKGVILLLAMFLVSVIFHMGGVFLFVGRAIAALDAYRVAERRRAGTTVSEDKWDFGA